MIAVSECLRGTPCRYDGMAKPNKGARELVKAGAVCICPEVLGGLDTPRSPAEIQGGDGFDVLCGKAKVVNKAGEDVTAQYVKGAEIVLELCKKYGVTEAVLKRETKQNKRKANITAMDKKSILVIDDDRNILAIIEMYLKKEGCTVTTCERGDTALEAFHKAKPDLVVLDVMLPGMDGWGVLGKIREESDVPVIMLTAKSDTMDRIQGLDLGADDYMVKPFEAKELIARIKAVMRRSGGQSEEKKVSFDNLVISLDNYSVLLDGKPVEMPPKEIELLYFLASRPGKVFTREQLLEQVWGFDFFGDSRTVDVHVKRIREKLGERDEWQLKTVWGVGYKFDVAK